MPKFLKITFFITLFANVAVAQNQFTLSGKITGEPEANLFIKYVNSDGIKVTDSCSLKDGTFFIKGKINHPIKFYLAVFKGAFKWRDDSDPNAGLIFVEPGNVTVKGTYGHLKDLVVSGSKSNDEYIAAQQMQVKDIVKKTNSYVAASYLTLYKSHLKLDSVEKLFISYSPAVKNSNYGKEIADYIAKMEQNSAGKPAKNFTATDLNGKKISMIDFKGRYVLLDFWGSWCAPCRRSTPHVVELFSKYHKSGLDVIAIAVDDKPDAWKTAIKQDGTELWYNIMENDLPSTQQIHDQYYVHNFPTKILVDTNGIIVGRYMGTDPEVTTALDKKLAEVFR